MTAMHWAMRDRTSKRLGPTLWVLLAMMGLVAPARAAQPRRYELDVRLDPEHRHVAVTGRVSVEVKPGESTLSFRLHETFRIAECAIAGEPARCARVEPDSPGNARTSRDVTVPLPEGAAHGLVELEIRYDGAVQNRPGWGQPGAEGPFLDDSAGPDRVELAVYSNWYPSFGYGPVFDVALQVTMPRGWVVTSLGERRGHRESQEETTTRWEARSVSDVLIIASPMLRSKDIETAAGRVRTHHTRLPESYLRREAQETEQTLLLFAEILGEASGSQMLQQVYSPRDWGQGFARPGMIVMAEGRVLRALEEDPGMSFVHGNAHEAAHFWWRGGAGQGDWINEAFAEYFAILAVRAVQGEGPFRDDLAEKRKAVRALPEDAPALAVVPSSNDGHGYTIKYLKGALMLDAFREHLGDDAFFGACRRFYEAIRGGGAGTDEFRAHWRKALRDNEVLSAWLDSPGSGPVPPDE